MKCGQILCGEQQAELARGYFGYFAQQPLACALLLKPLLLSVDPVGSERWEETFFDRVTDIGGRYSDEAHRARKQVNKV